MTDKCIFKTQVIQDRYGSSDYVSQETLDLPWTHNGWKVCVSLLSTKKKIKNEYKIQV